MPIDKSNFVQVIDTFSTQIKQAVELVKGRAISGEIANIVVCGMGGSAIAGDILQSLMRNTNMPVFVCRDYQIPSFVDEYSLVFLISYSGNTEETLSCLKQAKEKQAKIFAITSGGKLAEQVDKAISIPPGLQPRAALPFLFFPLLGLLSNAGILNTNVEDVNELLEIIKDTESLKDQAKEIAKKIKEKTAIIYASPTFAPAAYRWKTQINENAKQPAFSNSFSEMNHNEIAGYQFLNREEYISIFVRDDKDNERIKKRFDVAKEVIDRKIDIIEIKTKGQSLLARMFSTILLGDYVSYFLALHNRVDPAPVEIIEWFKKKLEE